MKARRSMRLLTVAWLTVLWVAFWEDLSVASIVGGLAVAGLLVMAFPLAPPGMRGAFRPAAAAHFALYFMWKLVEASFVVSWEVLTPRNRINEGIVAIPIRGVSDILTTLVANAISLTPGTLTLEIRRPPTVLYVHVLHLHDIDAVRRDAQYLEVLAIRAFGSAEAVSLAETQLEEASAEVSDESRTGDRE